MDWVRNSCNALLPKWLGEEFVDREAKMLHYTVSAQNLWEKSQKPEREWKRSEVLALCRGHTSRTIWTLLVSQENVMGVVRHLSQSSAFQLFSESKQTHKQTKKTSRILAQGKPNQRCILVNAFMIRVTTKMKAGSNSSNLSSLRII